MKLTGLEILRTPMDDNDADAETIGDYLVSLCVWAHGTQGKGLVVNVPLVTLDGSTRFSMVCAAYPEETKAKWYTDCSED